MADPTKKQIKVSAKNLGALNMPDACPRCFWIQQKCKPIPYQIFPGIFSSIDAYTKKIVQGAFDRRGQPPGWLPEFKNVFTHLKVPHWSKFTRIDQATEIQISGIPDGIFENIDKTITIPDYKTAKFTATQDKLYPMYVGQLNAYAWIQSALSPAKVTDLWLIYFEPVTAPPKVVTPQDASTASFWPMNKYTDSGFDLQFSVHTLRVEVDMALIDKLLAKAKVILSLVEPPTGYKDCKDCKNLSNLIDQVNMFR